VRQTAKAEYLLQKTSWILEAERSTLGALGRVFGFADARWRPPHHVRLEDLVLENGKVIQTWAMQVEMEAAAETGEEKEKH